MIFLSVFVEEILLLLSMITVPPKFSTMTPMRSLRADVKMADPFS
jgi:hypothetical protein